MSYTTGIELSKFSNRRNKRYSLREALNKVYLVKAEGKHAARIVCPKCLTGKRIKIILINE